MNYKALRPILLVASSLAVLVLAGCATGSLQPLSSRPPVPKITLFAPFNISGWEGYLPPTKYRVILPAGLYTPLYEDNQAYYYQAPSKVVVYDFTPSLYDGGIYVLRGSTTPAGWYYIGEDGGQVSGQFANPPPTRQ